MIEGLSIVFVVRVFHSTLLIFQEGFLLNNTFIYFLYLHISLYSFIYGSVSIDPFMDVSKH